MDKKLYPRIGEEVIWETLDNGLPVCIVPKQGFSRKYALFATRYGGMDMRFELNGQWLDTPAGIAHYLEHKMFDTKDGNALQELAKNGAEPNAFTSNAITCYYFDSTEKFYENLEILLSFVSVPYFTDESVEKEQGIIGQEIGMIEDNPEWQVYKQMMQALYRSSPARTPVAGSVESISHITAQTLYDCHKAFYTPANMCLVVVGDVDPETVLATAKRVLPAESGAIIRRDYGAEESTDAACGYAGGDSKDPKAVAEAILDEAQRLAAEGVDGDYYKRIVNANFGAALRELNAFESIAVSMAEGRFQGYDPYRFPEIYDDITAEDVRAFLRENFTRAHMALSVIAPKEG